jgi:hypothetical protein
LRTEKTPEEERGKTSAQHRRYLRYLAYVATLTEHVQQVASLR